MGFSDLCLENILINKTEKSMKKLVLVLSAILISMNLFANDNFDSGMLQNTTQNLKSGKKSAKKAGKKMGKSGRKVSSSRNGTYGTDNNGIGNLDTRKRSSGMNEDTTNNSRIDRNTGRMDGDMNNRKMGGYNDKMNGMSSDGIMMKDGKLMITQNGKTMPMETEMTLENGTRVMTDGTYMDKNGSIMRMKNGDHMMMSGKMMPMKKDKMD